MLLNSDQGAARTLVNHANELFKKRGKDVYYNCLDQTEGGGISNTITVDYWLEAIMQKIGLKIIGELHG
jgi:hypothetical protein